LDRQLAGPYRILGIEGYLYVVDLPPYIKMLNVFHVNQLRKDPDNPLLGQNRELEEPVLINGKPEYKVNKVLTSRVYRERLQYKVSWVGYNLDNTWYNADGFIGAPYKLKAFHDKRPHNAGPPVRLPQWLEAYIRGKDLEPLEEDNKAEKDGKKRRIRRA